MVQGLIENQIVQHGSQGVQRTVQLVIILQQSVHQRADRRQLVIIFSFRQSALRHQRVNHGSHRGIQLMGTGHGQQRGQQGENGAAGKRKQIGLMHGPPEQRVGGQINIIQISERQGHFPHVILLAEKTDGIRSAFHKTAHFFVCQAVSVGNAHGAEQLFAAAKELDIR